MAPFVFIVSNNAAWNIERYDQAENYGGRVVGTTLKHSDYAGMARAFGAYGERVETPDALTEALRRALDNAPVVLDVVTSQLVSCIFRCEGRPGLYPRLPTADRLG
jgi:acetolactate synthase-1/2/3 large subunit